MFPPATAFVLFLSLFSSVFAGPHAIPHGNENTGKIFPRTAGLASRALDPSVYLPTSELPLVPIELLAEPGLQGILTLDGAAELCPHFQLKNFALVNPNRTRYSAPWRVACDVDFYGGDLYPEPVSTQDGPVGCSVLCQKTFQCEGAVFWPSSGNPRSGSCYLKKTLNDPISRAGFAAVVRRNDLKPDFALTTDKRFFEGDWYDTIRNVYHIDTDDGEHHPDEKLFETYLHGVEASSGIFTVTSVPPSFSPVLFSATPPTLLLASTSAQITVTPVPIFFSTSPNSGAVPFVPASWNVTNTIKTTLVAVVSSSSMPSSNTMIATSLSQLSISLAPGTSLASSSTSIPFASPFIIHAAENELESFVKPTSTFKVNIEGFSTDAEWKAADITVADSHEPTRPTSSLSVYLEGGPTDVKPTAIPNGSSHDSSRLRFTEDAKTMSSSSTYVATYEPESSKPVSPCSLQMEGFPADIEWKSGSECSMPTSEGFTTDFEWQSMPAETARPTVSLNVPINWETYTNRPTVSLKVPMQWATETNRPTVSFKVPIDWVLPTTRYVDGAEPNQATSTSEVYMDKLPTDTEWKPPLTASVATHEPTLASLSFELSTEAFSTDIEWNLMPTKTSRPTVSLKVPINWASLLTKSAHGAESDQATASFKVYMEDFPTDIEWKPAPTASITDVDSHQADPLPSGGVPRPTSIELDTIATATTREIAQSLQAASSHAIHLSDGVSSAAGVAHACAMLNKIKIGKNVPLKARDVKACSAWLKAKRPVATTQSNETFSRFLEDTETLERIWGDDEVVLKFLKALNSMKASEKAAIFDYLKALDAEEAVEEAALTSTLNIPEATDLSATVDMNHAPNPTKASKTSWEVDAGPFNVEPAPSMSATLTKYLISTVSAGLAIVTRTRSTESNLSSTVYGVIEQTDAWVNPISKTLNSSSAHETDAAPTNLAMFTTTLLVGMVPDQTTQTAACEQYGHSCASMVVVFAPLATPGPSSKQGASASGHLIIATAVSVLKPSPSPQSWPTQTLQVAANIMPTVNPMIVACSLVRTGDVDCNKFASIVMTVVPMSTMPLSEYKTFITHKSIKHPVIDSSGAQAVSTPSVAIPHSPPANVPAPVQTLSSVVISVEPRPNPVQTTLAVSTSVVSPTGWLYGPPPRPDLPPPFGNGEVPSASISVAHVVNSSISSSTAPTSTSSGVCSTTMVPISPLPSKDNIAPGSRLLTGTVVGPTSLRSSGTGPISSSVSLMSTSTQATASSPKSSVGNSSSRNQPGMDRPGMAKPGADDQTTHNTSSAAIARSSASWITLLVSLFITTLISS